MRPIFVALDTPDVHRAAAIARQLCGLAGGMKLGLEFFCATGAKACSGSPSTACRSSSI